MLRNRSTAVTTKQALMADHTSLSSPSQKQTRPISSFFGSPRFVHGFLAKGPSETETTSPTSILDIIPFSTVRNQPFGCDKNRSKVSNNFSGNTTITHSWGKLDPRRVGLALIDSLNDEKADKNFSQPNCRMILFGSKLNIQIPPLPPSVFSPTESPKSPADFGIKTPYSQFTGSSSPFGSVNSSTQTKNSPQAFPRYLSASEMELSEDYTRVISHGPNPKTTHIYDNCVVESCCGVVGLSELEKQNCSISGKADSPLESFLSFCYTCKKNLEQGKDIFMYRGEKAFCSLECRCQEMLFDGVENPELGDAGRTYS